MITTAKSFLKWLIRHTILPSDLAKSGSLSDSEYGFLKQLVERANEYPGDFVEVGTLFGYTAQRLASWKAPGKKVLTVDQYSWNPLFLAPAQHEAVVAQNLYYLTAHQHVEMVRADKNEFYRTHRFATPPALVFLDAVHTYEETLKDIQWAQRIGVRVICGHDYCDAWPGVVQAVKESGGAQQVVGSLWVLPAST